MNGEFNAVPVRCPRCGAPGAEAGVCSYCHTRTVPIPDLYCGSDIEHSAHYWRADGVPYRTQSDPTVRFCDAETVAVVGAHGEVVRRRYTSQIGS